RRNIPSLGNAIAYIFKKNLIPVYDTHYGCLWVSPASIIMSNYQDLRSTAIYSVFLIIILDTYSTVSAFP
ncbi:MAG: hypothetical protein O4804_17160, partial [Trichodesmium sp. St11_bin5]|nr:hypothetical protein [Trichodesmium sp. St11_bin5]